MGARQRQWARKARAKLLAELGEVCQLCQKRGMRKRRKLHLDVILPVDGGAHHSKEWSWRISFYRQQHKAGNLQILCSYHNAQKGTKDAQWLQLQQAGAQCPF